ncbi:MAG: GTP-binding protein Der [Alphaproteobacteria bacterium]|jgi:GTP-binding protein|nr:GTP-binding protein Der [Alphaproteobacteria bacterium]
MSSKEPPYTIAIIGRPNVGKSTLFNRLVGKRLALVHDQPGMTRDRREGMGHLYGLSFTVIDTAGLADPDASLLTKAMMEQTLAAIAEADFILFVVDGREGCTPYDQDLAKILRRQNNPVLVLANKCEGRHGHLGLSDALSLGLGDVIAISAEHGEGLAELYDALVLHVPTDQDLLEDHEESHEEAPQKPLQLAIVGRPNVGKSTLINQLIGQDRLLTGDMPGVTRDAITLEWEHQGRHIQLTDTAGMRKGGRVTASAESLAVMDTRRTIQYAEVVIVLMDATAPLERQDLSIVSDVAEEGRALVLALNKWDLVKDKDKQMKEVQRILDIQLTQVRGIPCIPVSAIHGKNLNRLMDAVFQVYEAWNKRLPTAKLNQWLQYRVEQHPTPAVAGRRIRLKYITQIKTRPPTFALFASQAGELPTSYTRYLVNQMRQDFDLAGVPLRISLRSGKNPYVDKK